MEIKTSLFVDDISDPNSCKTAATLSDKVLENIQHQKFVTFLAAKCEFLLINNKVCDSLPLNSDKINPRMRMDGCENRTDGQSKNHNH